MSGVENFESEVARGYALHEQAFVDRDAAPIADIFYAPDADWAFQGYPAIRGRDAILAFYAGVVGQAAVRIDPIAASASEDSGWSLCDYHVRPEGIDPWIYRTLYAWEKVDGAWRVRVGSGLIAG